MPRGQLDRLVANVNGRCACNKGLPCLSFGVIIHPPMVQQGDSQGSNIKKFLARILGRHVRVGPEWAVKGHDLEAPKLD